MTDDSAHRKVLRIIGRGRDSPNNNNNEEPEDEYGSVPEHLRGRLQRKDEYLIDNGTYLFEELVKSTHGKNNSFGIFSLKELQKATNNFSDQILKGFPFPTYRGTIEGRLVAVKILRLRVMTTEVVSLSLIKHRNVVKLLGCCLETEDPIVVHELPPNGTLQENISKLSWTDRLRIATEIADVVAYLHSELHMTHRHIAHALAVQLDELPSAKLGFLGGSKIQNQADDEKENKRRKREDVFGFGCILLDLLSVEEHETSELVDCKEKAEIRKYLIFKLNVFEKERLQIEAFFDLSLRCRSQKERAIFTYVGEDELSIEEVARELRSIRSKSGDQSLATRWK